MDLTLSAMGGFGPIFQSALKGGQTNFIDFFIGASAIQSFVRSGIFRYGLPNHILSLGAKNRGGGGRKG